MPTGRRVARQLLPGSGKVSPQHLARELVHADAMVLMYRATFNLERADAWLEYRERVLGWRFDSIRGSSPRNLQLCPFCGHVMQFEPGDIRCAMCAQWWNGANP